MLRLGAVIAVVAIAIAMDTFAQLLIRYEQRVEYLASCEVSIKAVRNYSQGQAVALCDRQGWRG